MYCGRCCVTEPRLSPVLRPDRLMKSGLSLTFGDRGSSRVMNRRPGAVCISLATVWEQLRPQNEAAATAFGALLPRVGARSALLHQKRYCWRIHQAAAG